VNIVLNFCILEFFRKKLVFNNEPLLEYKYESSLTEKLVFKARKKVALGKWSKVDILAG
jgi:hypothetical protein